MKHTDLEKWGRRVGEWSSDYFKNLGARKVRAPTKPGEVRAAIDKSPPDKGQPVDKVFADFERIVMPNMTHWQHPRFFAYFPATSSPPSILAEWLTASLGAQCLLWQTSPAATEMEQAVLDWLRQMTRIGEGWSGMIQSGAAMATLSAILVARERALDWKSKETGLFGQPVLRVYASEHAHSSIEKAVFLSGMGRRNLVKVECDDAGAMRGEALARAIEADRKAGYVPCALCAIVGGTGVGASDRLDETIDVAKREGLFVHVDAAWAGSALICPEFQDMARGVERADSFVMNPHKWLMTNFDCSAHFFKSPEDLRRTMSITPAYLVTQDAEAITDFSQMSVELGRRFRALKLWFVIRCYGVEGLREIIRLHVRLAGAFAERLGETDGFEITSTPKLGLFSFRLRPPGMEDGERLDQINARFLDAVNQDGTLYLTQTFHEGRYVIRVSIGSSTTTEGDVDVAYKRLVELAKGFL